MLGVRRPSTVPVEDGDGGIRHVPLSEWRATILADELKRCWTEPAALAVIVERAIEAGLNADVLPAAEHLARIDPDRDRRYGLPAIVFARNGLFSRGEELLDRYASLYGETWYGLYARAEIALSGNRRARAQELLARSLLLEPDSSRPLRRLVEDAGTDGKVAVERAVRRVAEAAGGWRAKLLLAAELVDDEAEVVRLVRSAVEKAPGEPDVLACASSVLARRGLTARIVDFVAPRYRIDRDRLECGVNLLYALLGAGKKVAGEALLQKLQARLESAGLADHAEFYRAAFRNLREENAEERGDAPDLELLKAMAAAVRQGTRKSWRRCWTLLAGAQLLTPVTRAWIEVPPLESPWPDGSQLLELVTGVDSEGQEVVIAFTDRRTLRAWGPMRSPCVSMSARALLEVVAAERGCSLLLNPAGPTATELALPDIEAFLEEREPEGGESRIRFLAEPLRREAPPGFLDAAASFLRLSGIVRQAWLFEIVDDRSGVNPAIAVELVSEADPRDARELLLDGPDEVRWDSRRSRRVRFIPLDEGRFADYLRRIAIAIPVE